MSENDAQISNDSIRLVFDPSQLAIKSAILPDFKKGVGKQPSAAEPVNLVETAMYLLPYISEANDETWTLVSSNKIAERSLRYQFQQTQWISNVEFSLDESGYGSKIDLEFINQTNQSAELTAGLKISEQLTLPEKSSSFLPNFANQHQGVILGIDGKRTTESITEFCKSEEDIFTGEKTNIDFIGEDLHYFVKLFSPEQKEFNYRFFRDLKKNGCNAEIRLSQIQGLVGATQTVNISFRSYFGPKEVNALAQVREVYREAMDLGWFTAIGRPLLVVIKAIYANITFNYGLAIILLTICLKILFYPLTRAAAISMKRMQVLTPEINRIKEKYKNNREAQQREMMQFMSKNKVNPAKGCLPILPQIPVFIAFYNVLSQSIELRHAPFFGWIKDLSAADPYFITPILLGVGMFLQQKMTPNPTMDKTQEKVMLMMPVVFTFMMLSLPAGLVLYMITNTIISIAQQQWLNRTLKIPAATT